MQKLLLIVVLHLFAAGVADGATRNASPGTLNAEISQMQAGDTLYLKNGVYAQTLTNPLPSNSTMEGESREGVIIRPPAGGGSVILFSSSARSNITLKKLTLDAINLRSGETTGIRFQNTTQYTAVTLEDIEIKNMQGPGLVMGSGMIAPVVRRLIIHDSTGNNRQSPHGIYTRSHRGLYEDIEIYKIPCMGVNVRYDASGSSGNTFRGMKIYNTGYNKEIGWNCANGDDSGFDIQQPNTTVERSTIQGNADNGVRVRSGASAKLLNNIFYGNKRDVWPQGTTELMGNVYVKPVPIPDPPIPDPPKPDPVPVPKPKVGIDVTLPDGVELELKVNGVKR